MLKPSELFPVHQPPLGGLTRLRARLSEEAERRWMMAAGFATVTASVFALVLTPARLSQGSDCEDEFAAEAQLELSVFSLSAATQPEAVRARDGHQSAFQPVPLKESGVVFYRAVQVAPDGR